MIHSLPFFGMFHDFPCGTSLLAALIAFVFVGFLGLPLLIWTFVILFGCYAFGAPEFLFFSLVALLLILNLPPLRQAIFTRPLVQLLRRLNILPAISVTEKIALEAGSTWIDAELFSGAPNFPWILAESYPQLRDDERQFLDGPVEKVCALTQDWDVAVKGDLPAEAWDILKKERFFGMIIAKQYGGLEFSALGHSAVVAKLASRCAPLAITAMVPNSLGPAELLSHYGTDEQKKYYLPRLARGEEIPCFALTEPDAGSDAGSITSSGIIFRGSDGQLYVRLNWEKRYITLAAISTLLGLAVKLYDPENLLGKGNDLGITCLLVPTEIPGVFLGRRHNPLGCSFYNCPTEGKDVVVSIDQIIGGVQGAGQGWKMLMECLAAGRSISLPAQSAGTSKFVARVSSAYAGVRKQFGRPIGKFEGVEEPLARIGGTAYLLEAVRIFTCGAVDKGLKPAVISAIAKLNCTELARTVINDGMDVLGGAGISRGPRNLLGTLYASTPISITVEGANILTRTMIIFGQGAIRCHPYAYKEVAALESGDIAAFDVAFWRHLGFILRNLCRSVVLSMTRGKVARVPGGGATACYLQKIAWSSATFAFLTDLVMGVYGGNLKMREKITGRFADVLSWMYITLAVIRRFEAEGRQEAQLPFVHWALRTGLYRIDQGFLGIFQNIKVPGLTWLFRGPISWWSRLNPIGYLPSDDLGSKIVHGMSKPGPLRDQVTAGIFLPKNHEDALCRLDEALKLSLESSEIEKKIRAAIKSGKLGKKKSGELADEALKSGVISAEERAALGRDLELRAEVLRVDSFLLENYVKGIAVP